MTTKLIQKHLFKGTYEYEIAGERLNVRHKTPFGEEMHSIELAAINPEPLFKKSRLEFVSLDNGETLVSLMLARPDLQLFNDFVNALKRHVPDEYRTTSGRRPDDGLAEQAVYADREPPEFFEPNKAGVRIRQKVDVDKVAAAIAMLRTHLHDAEAEPLIHALEALQTAPRNDDNLARLEHAFNDLGIYQGAVLTYAPYVAALLSDDPFGEQ